MKRFFQCLMFLFLTGWAGLPSATAGDHTLPQLNAGIDQLAFQLTNQVAERYFDAKKRPSIRVAVFDFVDTDGNITTGSHYVATRIGLAFAKGLQFNLLPVADFEKRRYAITPEKFSKNKDLRDMILYQFKADIYVFGTFVTDENGNALCRVSLWGMEPPFKDWRNVKPIKVTEPMRWQINLTTSGEAFFSQILMGEAKVIATDKKSEEFGTVILLTQPICDDLNLSYQVHDGMVYDDRKEIGANSLEVNVDCTVEDNRNECSLRNRTGQVLQSRVKSRDTLKELSYVIKDISFIIKTPKSEAYNLELYVLPKRSDFYFLPSSTENRGFRFKYLWGKRGESKKPAHIESENGWKLHEASMDYENILPTGPVIATATFTPVVENQYGTKRSRPEYVNRFKINIKPGLNFFVINYVYRQDRPEIFVWRLEIDKGSDDPTPSIKKITEVFQLYGEK